MATRAQVKACTYRARNASSVEAKIDELSNAIDTLADLIDDVSRGMKNVETAVHRLKPGR